MSEGSLLGGAFWFLMCFGIFAGGVYLYVEDVRAVNSFEKTEATVISSDVRSGTDIGEYYAEIDYEYTVDGRTYDSSNVYPGTGQSSRSESKAREVVSNYPEGATVTAYYNPNDPSESYLIKERNTLIPLAMIGMGGLTSIGFGVPLGKRLLGLAT